MRWRQVLGRGELCDNGEPCDNFVGMPYLAFISDMNDQCE